MWFFVSPSLLLRTVPDPSAAHVSRKKGRSRLIGMETPVGSLISGTPTCLKREHLLTSNLCQRLADVLHTEKEEKTRSTADCSDGMESGEINFRVIDDQRSQRPSESILVGNQGLL